MTSGNQWRAEKAARRAGLTPLNEAVNAAYHACERNGGHVKGDERVVRNFLLIAVCANCGVPIHANRGWSSSASSQRGGRA